MTTAPPPPIPTSAERLLALANRVLRLSVSRTNPSQSWEDKSEVAAELRRLARRVEVGRPS
jgi:hypothetical protein